MSYVLAPALQTAIFQALAADAALSALLGGAIYDAIPPATPPATYALIGVEQVFDRSDTTGHGAEHRLSISVLSNASGFLAAKQVAARICEVLEAPALTLSRGRLVALWFDRAEARKLEGDQTRRIDLRFRARVEDD
ncbi:uncharacterized protein DUF3168 [Roseinatronobacter thiooxidans]|uniref:Uncharacterized protein DUF3168 n=1 Tax=Roseinatronobacter thiooxidans TaxID=121821 RepID=A0A2W7QQS3_9RHOB|nr:DUF3168 domain-containing protein [Roseinatronobacter thiooxidans]PZX46227.1 uncharacterized protein DUF3168 [Roseinatronobacter thiooxidans]